VTRRRVVVIGAGLGGLASAALLARAGHDVTVLERNDWVGGKSRRILVAGQRIDTGPSLVTFPAVIEKFLQRFAELGNGDESKAAGIADLGLQRLPEVGRYFFRGRSANLPVEEGHEWQPAWARFEAEHGPLGEQITTMLTNDPWGKAILPAAAKLFRHYGSRLNTKRYLDGLSWMPEDLREVISIHTLNAGVAPSATLALFATMPAVMATDGVWVPTGGVNELAQMLARLATESGASLRLNERVVSVSRRRVVTESATYEPDIVVSGLDAGVLDALRGKKVKKSRSASCSGIAVFAVLDEELPSEVVTHSVIMPDEPDDLYASIKNRTLPPQTMAFLNYYRAGHIYPNDRPTVAILLTAPPDGKSYDLTSEFVQREMTRISGVLGLPRQLADMITDHAILHPEYFAGFGGLDGALYGEGHPWWRSGPFHSPTYSSRRSPWLWRVGASVHPGGGIPAVLGGALISTNRLLKSIGTD
jgi:phytoene desaturase